MRSKHAFKHTFGFTLVALAMLAGCQSESGRPGTPVATTAGEPVSFWENLPATRTVCGQDALRALSEFGKLDRADELGHAERIKAMQAKGWLKADAAIAPEAAITRGQVAAILCPMLGIKGGLSMRANSYWGVSERYATRELVDLGIFPPASSPAQTLSGLELLRTLSFAERQLEPK